MMQGPEEQTVDLSMIKIGPIGDLNSKFWDEKGRSEIVQIFISHDDHIYSLQFQYFEDGKLVLSARQGSNSASKFDAVKLNYPSEYLTCVSGYKEMGSICQITFTTNLEAYGPFGKRQVRYDSKEFRFQLGKDKQFGGFYGSFDNYVGSIGLYIKPINTLNIQPNQNQDCSNLEDAAGDIEIQQRV